MRSHTAALTLLALALAGCKSTPQARPFVAPEIVEVPVTKHVSLPPEMTRECQITRAASRKVGDVVTAYNRNIVSLQKCNAQLKAIREAQPEAQP